MDKEKIDKLQEEIIIPVHIAQVELTKEILKALAKQLELGIDIGLGKLDK